MLIDRLNSRLNPACLSLIDGASRRRPHWDHRFGKGPIKTCRDCPATWRTVPECILSATSSLATARLNPIVIGSSKRDRQRMLCAPPQARKPLAMGRGTIDAPRSPPFGGLALFRDPHPVNSAGLRPVKSTTRMYDSTLRLPNPRQPAPPPRPISAGHVNFPRKTARSRGASDNR